MDRKTLLTTLLIGGGTDAGTAIAQLQHAVSVLDETKADKTGTVALANNLTPYSADSGTTQTIPFINQGTGCGNGESIVDTGSYSQVKKKPGNTAGVNQLVKNHDFSDGTDNWSVYDSSKASLSVSGGIATLTFLSNTGTYTRGLKQTLAVAPVIGRKYLISIRAKASAAGTYAFDFAGSPSASTEFVLQANTWTTVYLITTATGTSQTFIIEPKPGVADVNDTLEMSYVILSDLTLWYGSNDRIPAHLLSHPEDFGRYYSGSLAYNPGQLVNADGSVLTSIGRNVWDEEWEVGGSDGQGGQGSAQNAIISKNYRPAIPNQAYYFYCAGYTNIYYLAVTWYDANKSYLGRQWCCGTTATAPSNAAFFKIYTNSGSYIYGGTYNNDITVSLYYPGESGYNQYYPFSVLAQIDTGSEVLRSSFGVADEKEPSGLITRKIDYYTILGTDVWRYFGTPETGFWYLDAKFPNSAPSTQVMNGKGIYLVTANATGQIRCYPQYNTGVITNETDMSTIFPIGSVFHCARTTPTTEQGTAFSGASADNFAIDDFGSMYWTQSAGVPQGVEIFYPYDYKAAVDTLLNMVEGDVEELVTETELGAVADRIPEAPAEDGTYTFKATVADGVKTYAWVADA